MPFALSCRSRTSRQSLFNLPEAAESNFHKPHRQPKKACFRGPFFRRLLSMYCSCYSPGNTGFGIGAPPGKCNRRAFFDNTRPSCFFLFAPYGQVIWKTDIRYPGAGATLKGGSAGVCAVSGAPMWARRRARLILVKQPGAFITAGRVARLDSGSAAPLSLSPSLPLSLSLDGRC